MIKLPAIQQLMSYRELLHANAQSIGADHLTQTGRKVNVHEIKGSDCRTLSLGEALEIELEIGKRRDIQDKSNEHG